MGRLTGRTVHAPDAEAARAVAAVWPGVVQVLDEVDSTMDEARRAALAGAPHGTTLLARTQRRGRGRSGADWDSPAGAGLYATTLLYLPADVAVASLSPAWALACAEALIALGADATQLKWPNDLWVHGHKLAGLLLQREPIGPTGCCVLVGVGVNLAAEATVPRAAAGPAALPRTHLAATPAGTLGAEAVLAALLAHCAPAYVAWRASGLTPELRRRYDARHALHGQDVCGEAQGERVCGRVLGLQPCGGLELACADGTRLVQAGAIARVRAVG